MIFSQRLYYGVAGSLPYVVLAVGVVSVVLAALAFLTFPTSPPGSAWWALLFGGFLVWAGTRAVRDRRRQDDDPSDEP